MWFCSKRKPRLAPIPRPLVGRRSVLRRALELLEDRVVPASFEFPVTTQPPVIAPSQILVVPHDNSHIWFVDEGSDAICRIDTTSGATFGDVVSFAVTGSQPVNFQADWAGNIWYSTTLSPGVNSITEMDKYGNVLQFQSTSYSGPFAPDPSGNVWFPSGQGGLTRLVMSDGSTGSVPPPGYNTSDEVFIQRIDGVDQDGHLWFSGYYTHLTPPPSSPPISATGQFYLGFYEIGSTSSSPLLPAPAGVAAGANGSYWFSDNGASTIRRVSSDGHVQEYALPPGVATPSSIAADVDGNLWFIDPNSNTIGRLVLSNQPPAAGFEIRDSSETTVTTVYERQSYHFDAQSTADVDGTNLICQWQVNGVPVANSGSRLNLTVPEDGSVVIALSVEDPFTGLTSDFSQTITVHNLAPSVELNLADGGGLDSNFGVDGVARTDVSATGDVAFSPTQLPDGRVVVPFRVGGVVAGFRRFLATGSPDSSFGPNSDGRITIPSSPAFAAYAMQGDKIVLATKSGSTLTLARLNADGSPDTGFGTFVVSNAVSGPVQMAVMADDDRIFIVGGTATGMAVFRRSADGSFESEVQNTTPYHQPAAMIVQSDGIVVGEYTFAVLRFHINGTLDHSFGVDDPLNPGQRTGWSEHVTIYGTDTASLLSMIGANGDTLSAVALAPDGSVFAVDNFGIVKYTSDGRLDNGFGPYGDGSVIFTGGIRDWRLGQGFNSAPEVYEYVSRWVDLLDIGLGGNSWDSVRQFPAGFAVQSDGKILVGGATTGIARLNGDGSLDRSFGPDQSGRITVPISGQMFGMALQAGGHATLLGNNTGAIQFVRLALQPRPDHVVAGQTVTLNFGATDPGPADQAAGFVYQIDWDGDGTWDETISRTPGNASGLVRTHVYGAVATTTNYSIRVSATDKDGGQSESVIPVTVEPASGSTTLPTTALELQTILDGSLATDPVSGLPAATFAVTTAAAANGLISLAQEQTLPVAIVLNGAGVQAEDVTVQIPSGVTVVLNGFILNGGSPALTLISGNLIVTNSTFVNATDAPTILVTGGHLTLRNNVIQESTGYNQAAIQVSGGFVDLGTAADPGGNTININRVGAFFLNATSTPISVFGDTFTKNGVPYVVAPSSVQGLVWLDSNNNAQVDFGEQVIPGVAISLSGIDDLGNIVRRLMQTDVNGIYFFSDVRPSNSAGYSIAEVQPAAYLDGRDVLGTVNGIAQGSAAVNDIFAGVVVSQGASIVENYNFGEQLPGVGPGQTAGIGFWQNNKGQSLIKALNGGASATQLGHWLAVTFPNMYGGLDGLTNAGVASFYKTLFARNGHSSPGGPPKTDAQVMATALAVYVTNQTLAGTTATAYGFQVTETGVGARTFNVGNRGAAFGVANNSSVSVLDLLLAVNARSHNGLLYDIDGNGQIDSTEATYRTMANDLFSAINEAGDI